MNITPRKESRRGAMRVLIACEFSGIVRDAFAAKGHDSWSCDLLPTERPGNHIQGDVLAILNDGWDLMIAHPPCRFLAVSGARWMKDRQEQTNDALEFVQMLMDAPIPKICIENPNIHPAKQIELLAKIIEAQGWRSPITVSNLSGMIVRGHGRYEAARRLLCAEVPVDFQDYASEAEEWQDLLADNRIAELSQVDDDLLSLILQDIDLDVELTGYDAKFVSDLIARKEIGELRREILSEEEYQEARNTAEAIITSLADKITRLAKEEPGRLNGALAVILQKGRGNAVLFLADPNTADAVAELRRLEEAGDPSPLETIFTKGGRIE